MVINSIQWFMGLVGILGIVGICPLVITGIVFIVKSKGVGDEVKAKKYKKIGIWLIVLPFLMIVIPLSVTVILAAISTGMGTR